MELKKPEWFNQLELEYEIIIAGKTSQRQKVLDYTMKNINALQASILQVYAVDLCSKVSMPLKLNLDAIQPGRLKRILLLLATFAY